MTRALLVALATLALAATPALAQDADEQFDPDASPPVVVTPGPDDDDDGDAVDGDEAEPDAEATPDPCVRPPGTDGDYVYCGDPCVGPDGDYGADGYYVYCVASSPSGPGPEPKRRPRPRPVGATQPLPAAQLPLTGGDPVPLALIGLAFLMCGAGLRLRSQA